MIRLRLDDLPSGWEELNMGSVAKSDTQVEEAYYFGGPPSTKYEGLSAMHRVIVAASSTAAIQVYSAQEAELFSTEHLDWKTAEQLPLGYENKAADQSRLGCSLVESKSSESVYTCASIAQYDDLVSIFFVTKVFEEKWFTWEDMERVLKAIDERMAAEMR